VAFVGAYELAEFEGNMSLLTGFDSFNIVIVNCRKRETGGFPPVPVAEVATGYLRETSNPITGRIIKHHKTKP